MGNHCCGGTTCQKPKSEGGTRGSVTWRVSKRGMFDSLSLPVRHADDNMTRKCRAEAVVPDRLAHRNRQQTHSITPTILASWRELQCCGHIPSRKFRSWAWYDVLKLAYARARAPLRYAHSLIDAARALLAETLYRRMNDLTSHVCTPTTLISTASTSLY